MRGDNGGQAVGVDVVICTYNRAQALDEVLRRLSQQAPSGGIDWSVTVIDNASTDATADVVQRHAAERWAPVRYVYEPEQGLTPARLRGVRETTRPWIAFVDDDNLLAPDWLAAMAGAIRAHPSAGAIGGRVRLAWDVPPLPAAAAFGFCFAEQELGEAPCAVASLVGAGMVLRRAALEASGWTERPLLADRTGRSLVSGGDAEIALRVRSAGFELRYEPRALMDHRMPAARSTRGYLMRINRALGATSVVISLLAWPGDHASWRVAAEAEARARWKQAVDGLLWSLRNRREITAGFAWLSYARGMRLGLRHVAQLAEAERQAILGRAAPAAVFEAETYPEARTA